MKLGLANIDGELVQATKLIALGKSRAIVLPAIWVDMYATLDPEGNSIIGVDYDSSRNGWVFLPLKNAKKVYVFNPGQFSSPDDISESESGDKN